MSLSTVQGSPPARIVEIHFALEKKTFNANFDAIAQLSKPLAEELHELLEQDSIIHEYQFELEDWFPIYEFALYRDYDIEARPHINRWHPDSFGPIKRFPPMIGDSDYGALVSKTKGKESPRTTYLRNYLDQSLSSSSREQPLSDIPFNTWAHNMGEVLVRHALIYGFAQTYQIHDLARLAFRKLRWTLLGLTFYGSTRNLIVDLVRYIYSKEACHALRETVVGFVGLRWSAFKGFGSHKRLMIEFPEYAHDLQSLVLGENSFQFPIHKEA